MPKFAPLEAYSRAARRKALRLVPKESRPAYQDWHGYHFAVIEGLPAMTVTGAIVAERITRGRRRGRLNYRKMDRATQITIGVTDVEARREERRAQAEDVLGAAR